MAISHPSNQIVQGLWIDGRLSTLEKLSIASFIIHGHTYHLYTYGLAGDVPEGTVLKDASEILPRSSVFKSQGSQAIFADLFRYQLLYDRGGWWADTDVIALRAFEFNSEYVFASERARNGRDSVTTCVIKAPPKSELFMSALEFCRKSDFDRLPWAMSGPGIMHRLIFRSPLCCFVQESDAFCPINFDVFWRAVLPFQISKEKSFGIHLWNELWRRYSLDKDAKFAPDSAYEVLKMEYLGLT